MTDRPTDVLADDRMDGCITCGDVAIPLVVVAVDGDGARCRDDDTGREEHAAIDLVGPVEPGDRVLVHAGVALLKLERRT